MATIDLDGSATELTKPPAKAVAIPAAATSASPIARAHGRAPTDTPTAIVSLRKKPVALDSFVQKPTPEAKPTLPKPRTNGKPAALPSANTDKIPDLFPRDSTDGSDGSTQLPIVTYGRAGAPPSPTDAKAAVPPREVNPNPGPSKAGNRLPPPLQTPRSMPVASPPVVAPSDAALPVVDMQSVKDRLPTEVATPPPPPIVVARSSVRKAAESTQLVPPLPLPIEPPVRRAARAPTPAVIVEPGLAEIETIGTTGASRRSWIAAGVLSAMAIAAVILVIVSDPSGGDVPRAKAPVGNEPAAATSSEVKPLPSQPAAEPPRPERTARNSEPPPPPEPPRPERTARNSEPPPPPEPPRPERTARNSEPPPATEVAAQVPTEPPPSKIQAPPKNAITPPTSEATPPRRPSPPPTALAPSPPKRASPPSVTHKPVQVAKPVAKPPVKTQPGPQPRPPARAIKQPTYDPDALFLKNP